MESGLRTQGLEETVVGVSDQILLRHLAFWEMSNNFLSRTGAEKVFLHILYGYT